jgi:hypothetical protein
MATNRPNNGLYASSSDTRGTPGIEMSVTTRIYGFVQLTPTSILPYVEGYSWKDSVVSDTPLITGFNCWFNNPGPYSTPADYSDAQVGNGDSITLSYQPTITFTSNISNVTLSITAQRLAAVFGGGTINLTNTVTFTVKDHPGKMFTFVSTPYTYLRLPFCSAATAGQLFFIKNTTATQMSIAPHIDQPTCPIEDLVGAVTIYRFLTYPLLNLQPNQSICLVNDGIRWHVVMFYAGSGAGVSRAGGTARTINAADITEDFLYGSLNSSHMRINLPDPSTRQLLMILADRNGTDNSNQIQLNAPSGSQIDGRFSTFDISITSNRRGNCSIVLISNGTTWYIASVFDMTDMDNYSTGTVTPTPTPVTNQIGFVTSTTTSTNVWVGRSYNVASISPTLNTIPASNCVLRVFKQYNTVSVGFGLKTSDSSTPFPESFTNGPEASKTQMFLYNAYGNPWLRALFCVELDTGGTRKILFAGQYPARF